jgi:MYXO-CTERM domain-containing protein
VLLASIALLSPAAAQAVEYRLDGFEDGAVAGFQAGFVSGEMGAVCFHEPDDRYPVRIQKIRFLFGDNEGNEDTRFINVKIFSSGGDGVAPSGLLLDLQDVEAISSVRGFNELDVSGEGISVSGPWCVGIEFTHDGPPSIARDDDGTFDAGNNWILASDLSGGYDWYTASTLLVQGDWIIRTEGTPAGGTVADTGGRDTTVEPDVTEADTTSEPDTTEERDTVEQTDTSAAPDTEEVEVRVLSISPSSAVEDEEVAVQIAGRGFSDDFQYRIGPAQLTSVQVIDDAVVQAVLPAMALTPGTYDVIVLSSGEEVAFSRSAFQVRAASGGGGGGCAAAGGSPSLLFGLLGLGLVAIRRRRS